MKNQLGHHPAFKQLAGYRSCWRKERHATRAKAEAALRSLEKRNLTQDHKGTLHVYECPVCKGFHTGHVKS